MTISLSRTGASRVLRPPDAAAVPAVEAEERCAGLGRFFCGGEVGTSSPTGAADPEPVEMTGALAARGVVVDAAAAGGGGLLVDAPATGASGDEGVGPTGKGDWGLGWIIGSVTSAMGRVGKGGNGGGRDTSEPRNAAVFLTGLSGSDAYSTRATCGAVGGGTLRTRRDDTTARRGGAWALVGGTGAGTGFTAGDGGTAGVSTSMNSVGGASSVAPSASG